MEIKRSIITALILAGSFLIVKGQAVAISGDQYHLYGPNSTWSQYLQVGGNGQATGHAFVAATNGNLHLDSRAGFGTYINYYNMGNTYLNANGGRVGIGTTNPGTTFEVQQANSGWNMNSRVNAVYAGEINGFKFYSGYFGDDKWAGIASVAESLHSNKTGLALYAGMTERLRISDEGYVGIGIDNPTTRLQVKQATSGWTISSRVGAALPGELNGLKFYSGYLGDDKWAGIASVAEDMHSNSTGLSIYTNQNEKVRVTADGRVGIGTTQPLAKLRVVGGGVLFGHNATANDTDGSLSIGDILVNSTPNTSNWTSSTNMLISGLDYTTIGFHDAAERVDFIRSGKGTIELGYDGGWGHANIALPNGIWNAAGNLGLGTVNPTERLTVNGKIKASEIRVDGAGAPDYVFEPGYKVATLEALESYIKANKHLPEVPSAKEFERDGIAVGEMNKLLLKKIEELTLHLIEKDKQYNGVVADLKKQEERLRLLEKRLEKQ